MPIDLSTSNKHLRYCVLSRRLTNIASEGSIIDRKFMFVTEECKKIEDRLDEMTIEDEQAKIQNKKCGKQPAAPEGQTHADGFPDFLEILMLLLLRVVQRVLKGKIHLLRNYFQKTK
jgi:hypothetical protein